MRRSVFRTVLWALLLTCLLADQGWSQNYYEIIAVKGKVGIIRTPMDRNLKIGDTYRVVRFVGDRLVPVAEVRVALVEKKYCGIRVVAPIGGRVLTQGDLLEIAAENVTQKLDKLEQSWPVEVSEPVAAKDEAGGIPQSDPVAPDPQPAQNDGQPAGPDRTILLPPPGLLIPHPNRPFIGPIASFFVPVNFLAEEVRAVPSFGVQVTTLLHKNSHLQMSIFYVPQKYTPKTQARFRSQGVAQTAYMINLNLALQQYITRSIFWTVGMGLYRISVEQVVAGEVLHEAFNNIGFNAGVGAKILEISGTRLSVWSQGHLYFPEKSYRTYMTLMASWSVMF